MTHLTDEEHEAAQLRLLQRLDAINRRRLVIDEQGPAYVRGEQLARAIIDNFEALTRAPRLPVHVNVFDRLSTHFDAEAVDPWTTCVHRSTISCVAILDPPLPGFPDSHRRARLCFRDELGRWLAWMRKDMPDGIVNPDVAAYYAAQGIERGPWEVVSIEAEIEDVRRQFEALANGKGPR
jgi:hypothetical protein